MDDVKEIYVGSKMCPRLGIAGPKSNMNGWLVFIGPDNQWVSAALLKNSVKENSTREMQRLEDALSLARGILETNNNLINCHICANGPTIGLVIRRALAQDDRIES